MQPSVPPLLVLPTGRALVEALLRLTVSPSRARAVARLLVPAGGGVHAPEGRCHAQARAAGLSADEAELLRALPMLLRRAGDRRDRLTLLCVDAAGRLLCEQARALHPHEEAARVASSLACSALLAGSAVVLAIRTPATVEAATPSDGDLRWALACAMAANGLSLADYLVVGHNGSILSRR